MRKLSVVYLVPSLTYGGAETLLLSTIKALDKEKFTAEIQCFYDGGELLQDFLDAGIVVHEWRAARRNPFTFARLIRDMRRRGYDIAHTHLFDRQGRVAAYLAGIPIILTTYHSAADWENDGSLKGWFKVVIDSLTAHLDDRIIVVSEDVRGMAVTRGRLPLEKIVTVENGIDVESYALAGNGGALRQELGLNGKRIILTIGRLCEQKDHATLIKAARILREEFSDLVILIAGEGPLMESLHSEIAENRVEENVRIIGYRKDIAALLSLADIFVLPSLYEGMPLALLEAMAAGKPIVAADVPGIQGIIEDGVNGFLVPARDERQLAKAIANLLVDKSLSMSIARGSRDSVKQRSGRMSKESRESTLISLKKRG